ncbi:tyrosine-type recombinase/integrase [Alicyclobacillus herbarius]|uniref:tyrosine-type recombinase/integrase n=1 Tax=Alicyclobacillus herbarius TaxID=122960 RepID=UPI000409900E|nr:tyrosine-type recombinase/integrase [Alicyclobacillus herbarius]
MGLKATTINNERRYLGAFFHYLVRKGILPVSPVANIGKIREDETGYGSVPDPSEIWRLIQQPNRQTFSGYRDATLIQVLVDIGMRISQCLALRVEDVDTSQRIIRVRPEINKTKQGRNMVITEGTAYMLSVLIRSMAPVTSEDLPWLWITDEGTNLTYTAFIKQLHKYARMAGLDPKHISPHILRHYSAVQHCRNGATLEQVQALLGHKNIQTTMRYLRGYKHDLREINNRYSPAHDLIQKPGRKPGKRKITWTGDAPLMFSDYLSPDNP